MSQTAEGARKAVATIKDRYGVDKDGRSLLHKRVGAIGGKATGLKGFALNRELAREAGRKGGLVSRKGRK